MPSAAGTCALPMDGLNACPPEAHSCFTCPHYRSEDPRQLSVFDRLEAGAHVKARIFDALRLTPGGLTFEGVSTRTRLNPNTVRGRLSELEAAGIVHRVNRRRPTEAGRRASVYVVTGGAPCPV